MPVIYKKSIRRKFASLDLEKVKNRLDADGFEFVRDGGFRKDDPPFKFSNYLFYNNPITGMQVRIGYDYPIFGNKNHIFEICYIPKGGGWWIDVTPDFRYENWRSCSNLYN